MAATFETVTGPYPVEQMGLTLTHEHILVDARSGWNRPKEDSAEEAECAFSPVAMKNLGLLRNNPYLSLDNMVLESKLLAAEELSHYVRAGGNTIIEQTPEGLGRDPLGLKWLSETTGVKIVMGAGFYLERSHPEYLRKWDIDRIHDHIVSDVIDGIDGVKAGIIGEIALGAEFSEAEDRVLRGAARAQKTTGVPLEIHLSPWTRRGHEALDIVGEEGGNLSKTVLCHMNPSGADEEYQIGLIERGSYLQYDMIGQENYFPGEGQCSSDGEDAESVARLYRQGHGKSLLLSSDVFLKIMLRAFGGFGYAHVLNNFIPRLTDAGMSISDARSLLEANPAELFTK